MGITLVDNCADLLGDSLCIEDRGIEIGPVRWGPRIGINVGLDRLWRGYVAGHAAVSGTRPAQRHPQVGLYRAETHEKP
jgi:3-methyladenine DNA glycosylase Mpg